VCVCVCLIVCDLETSTMRWPCSQLGCDATKKILYRSNYSPILFSFTNKWVKFSLLCTAYRVVSCRMWTSRPGVTWRSARVDFVVDKMALEQVSVREIGVFPVNIHSIFIYILSGGRTVDPWYGAVPPRISSHRKKIQRGMAGMHS
jgi:hypothetical protein